MNKHTLLDGLNYVYAMRTSRSDHINSQQPFSYFYVRKAVGRLAVEHESPCLELWTETQFLTLTVKTIGATIMIHVILKLKLESLETFGFMTLKNHMSSS